MENRSKPTASIINKSYKVYHFYSSYDIYNLMNFKKTDFVSLNFDLIAMKGSKF